MKKSYAFLTAVLLALVVAPGCSGFKGFCDRGSLFPTRQSQLVPTQTMYTVTGDMCCPGETMSMACDPCGGVSGSNTAFPGPSM
ncbi:MAG: hypothetical protein FWH27_15195 [Planctomycetaceae bacterium]|nr:hypothetical protein [Planctomycetaceae bacterium]